ncbi:MAG: MBL fold metallo-hydrolase [Deltaproteobacteria bacterium]|nr:MAG: MBL fold metallo-hydrolase [Deltaproteobacteria bacterium]
MKEPILIEIPQDEPGYDGFIGSWLIQGAHSILVDVGPANTAERLIARLEDLGISELDYVLITHIHIDHAGALGPVLSRYPGAMAVCHEKAVNHVVDPQKLWQGSLKVLGDVAKMYGPPKPVSPQRVMPHTGARVEGLLIIDTPGHAPHHLCYEYEGRLFAGEAAGNYLNLGDKDYLRPATPPRFFLETFLSSIDRLLGLPDEPIYYAHFGFASSSHRMLRRFKSQVLLWADLIEREISQGGEGLVDRCVEKLLREDGNLQAFNEMDPEAKRRELNFMANAVKGFLGYFEEKN